MGSGFHDGNILYPCSALCTLVSGGFAVNLPGCCLWSGSDTPSVLQAPPLLPEVCQTHLRCFVLITAGCPKFWVQTSQNENLLVFWNGFCIACFWNSIFCLCFIPHISSQFLLENLTSRYSLHPCSALSLGGTRPPPGVSLYFVSIRVLVPVTQSYRDQCMSQNSLSWQKEGGPTDPKELAGPPTKVRPGSGLRPSCSSLPTTQRKMKHPEEHSFHLSGWSSLEWKSGALRTTMGAGFGIPAQGWSSGPSHSSSLSASSCMENITGHNQS